MAFWAVLRVLNLNRSYKQTKRRKDVCGVLRQPRHVGAIDRAALRSAIAAVAEVASDCGTEAAYQRIFRAMPSNVDIGIPVDGEDLPTLASGSDFANFRLFLAECRQDNRRTRPKVDYPQAKRARLDTTGATAELLCKSDKIARRECAGVVETITDYVRTATMAGFRAVTSRRAPSPSTTASMASAHFAEPQETTPSAPMGAPPSSEPLGPTSPTALELSGALESEKDKRDGFGDADQMPASPIEVAARDAPLGPTPSACTLGGGLRDALEVPEDAVERALDESARADRRPRAAEIAAGLDALDGRLALAPFAAPVAPGGLVLRGEESLGDREIWAIGDLHGDLLGLECCVAAIERAAEGRPHLVVFLGDLIDDGPLSYDTMLRAMELFAGAPDRFALLVGNHDVALSFDETAAAFSSDVEPGDLADALNAMQDQRAVAAARAFVRLVARAPRALFLPDGTLAAHGGVPQSDLWTGLTTPADLDGRFCRDDFVWCRAHERAKRRLPSRGLRGAEFGREDFAEFCALASERLGLPTGRMLRGHDHFEQRFCLYELYAANPIVGVNAMCRRLERELFGPPARRPVVARWRAGETIDLFPVGVPEAAVAAMFGPPEMDAAADAVPEAGS